VKWIVLSLLIVTTAAGIVRANYQQPAQPELALSRYVPAGPLLYLEAKDFSALLAPWNASPQKEHWVASSNYEVFSRSRLFLRLKAASDQFAAAAGFPSDMNFLAQVAGSRSALAIYDIGNLHFLYITQLPSAKSTQTVLWQGHANFESRSAGGIDFYVRRDPQSQREVAFAISGDYLLLATREDLIAGALQLMSGAQDRSAEGDAWWGAAVRAAGPAGDLRMVMNLEKIVPGPYFRTYWVQQNITDLKQYSAAISDLYRSGSEYREERVLLRKAPDSSTPGAGESQASQAAADLVRLVPEDAGLYEARAEPNADTCLDLLETKLLAPHLGPVTPSQLAPAAPSGGGDVGASADLETRIDQPAIRRAEAPSGMLAAKNLLAQMPIAASLEIQSSGREKSGVFVQLHSTLVFSRTADWNQQDVEGALVEALRPSLTASQLGVGWQPKSGYKQLDGLLPLAVSVHGKYLLISDDAAMMEKVLANFNRKVELSEASYLGGFSHAHERANFALLAGVVDGPYAATGEENARPPQFFGDNIASLSSSLSDVASEKIVVRNDHDTVRQTVTYQWSK
jgi:hypothetical protein